MNNLIRSISIVISCISITLLTACGNSKIHEPFTPSQIITLGDSFTNIGDDTECGVGRLGKATINLGCDKNPENTSQFKYNFPNGIAESVAHYAGLDYKNDPKLIINYAKNNALIRSTDFAQAGIYIDQVDSLEQQVTKLINDKNAGTVTFDDDTLIIVSAGTTDIIIKAQDDNYTDVDTLAKAYLAQIDKLAQAGAKHVVFFTPYNLALSPWANEQKNGSKLEKLLINGKNSFNKLISSQNSNIPKQAFLFPFNDYLSKKLPHDIDLYYSSDNKKKYVKPVCEKAINSGKGIGIGHNQIDASLCTPDKLITNADNNEEIYNLDKNSFENDNFSNLNHYYFADKIYLTPKLINAVGFNLYENLRNYKWD